jgi:hypothetical protein
VVYLLTGVLGGVVVVWTSATLDDAGNPGATNIQQLGKFIA